MQANHTNNVINMAELKKDKLPSLASAAPTGLCDAIYKPAKTSPLASFPLYTSAVAAGFPSPASDDLETPLDLNEHLVKHPAATFMVKVSGDSMIDAGMYDKDILIVDRSLTAANGRIVIAVLDGLLTVKRFYKTTDNKILLVPANDKYAPLEVSEGSDFRIWGVVTTVIHAV